MRTIAIALVLMLTAGFAAADGFTLEGTAGYTRIDTSFSDLSIPRNETFGLGFGYMWKGTERYTHGVALKVDRYNTVKVNIEGEDESGQFNANSYAVVYQGEVDLGDSPVVFTYDAGYSLLDTKISEGGPDFANDGITGSVGLGYRLGKTGATMLFVEAQGARYFDMWGSGGDTMAIMAGNVGIRHQF